MEIPTWEEIEKSLHFGNTDIATGYFARCKHYEKLGYYIVPICGKVPDYFNSGTCYKKLAPKIDFFFQYKKGNITKDEYIEQFYTQVLSQFSSPKRVLRDLKELTKERKIVLVCYEKPFDFCHRHIVSYWISSVLDMEIREVQLK